MPKVLKLAKAVLASNKFMQQSFQAFQFKSGEVIASIGAASGVWEIGFASMQDDLTIYIQDIDADNCNAENLDYTIRYWEKFTGKRIQGTFLSVVGTATQTNLPRGIFDKVLLINCLHEFSHITPMLDDIATLLKPSGVIFIEEQLSEQEGTLHEGCGKPLFTHDTLCSLLHKHGLKAHPVKDKGQMVWIYRAGFFE